jgi:hypothetical protein
MNDRFEFPSSIEPEMFDRLVDGELSATEEQALLGALDARPDAWRHCALAFLEARAWRDDLTAIARPRSLAINGTSAAIPRTMTIGKVASTESRSRFTHVLSIAAAVLVAFFFGFAARAYWTPAPAAQEGVIVQHPDRNHRSATDLATGADAWEKNQISDSSIAAADMTTVTMALVSNNGQQEREIEIPLVETDQFDPRWLESRPQAMPQSVVEALQRRGHQVDQRRLYVPVVLDDGRRAILPLDQAEVKFTGMQL